MPNISIVDTQSHGLAQAIIMSVAAILLGFYMILHSKTHSEDLFARVTEVKASRLIFLFLTAVVPGFFLGIGWWGNSPLEMDSRFSLLASVTTFASPFLFVDLMARRLHLHEVSEGASVVFPSCLVILSQVLTTPSLLPLSLSIFLHFLNIWTLFQMGSQNLFILSHLRSVPQLNDWKKYCTSFVTLATICTLVYTNPNRLFVLLLVCNQLLSNIIIYDPTGESSLTSRSALLTISNLVMILSLISNGTSPPNYYLSLYFYSILALYLIHKNFHFARVGQWIIVIFSLLFLVANFSKQLPQDFWYGSLLLLGAIALFTTICERLFSRWPALYYIWGFTSILVFPLAFLVDPFWATVFALTFQTSTEICHHLFIQHHYFTFPNHRRTAYLITLYMYITRATTLTIVFLTFKKHQISTPASLAVSGEIFALWTFLGIYLKYRRFLFETKDSHKGAWYVALLSVCFVMVVVCCLIVYATGDEELDDALWLGWVIVVGVVLLRCGFVGMLVQNGEVDLEFSVVRFVLWFIVDGLAVISSTLVSLSLKEETFFFVLVMCQICPQMLMYQGLSAIRKQRGDFRGVTKGDSGPETGVFLTLLFCYGFGYLQALSRYVPLYEYIWILASCCLLKMAWISSYERPEREHLVITRLARKFVFSSEEKSGFLCTDSLSCIEASALCVLWTSFMGIVHMENEDKGWGLISISICLGFLQYYYMFYGLESTQVSEQYSKSLQKCFTGGTYEDRKNSFIKSLLSCGITLNKARWEAIENFKLTFVLHSQSMSAQKLRGFLANPEFRVGVGSLSHNVNYRPPNRLFSNSRRSDEMLKLWEHYNSAKEKREWISYQELVAAHREFCVEIDSGLPKSFELQFNSHALKILQDDESTEDFNPQRHDDCYTVQFTVRLSQGIQAEYVALKGNWVSKEERFFIRVVPYPQNSKILRGTEILEFLSRPKVIAFKIQACLPLEGSLEVFRSAHSRINQKSSDGNREELTGIPSTISERSSTEKV
mmetsp:Transcript_4580/g.5165  ORF Transcript_4580/g.5165 Transcript_4580/m.5165 type:complete len:1002 (-) Transcript_4580:100-3105(-)